MQRVDLKTDPANIAYDHGARAYRDCKIENDCPYFSQNLRMNWIRGFYNEMHKSPAMETC